MRLKEEFKGLVISKRINGKMITFDTDKGMYDYYYNIGFNEYFEEENKSSKRVKWTNDSNTSIIDLSSLDDVKIDKGDEGDY